MSQLHFAPWPAQVSFRAFIDISFVHMPRRTRECLPYCELYVRSRGNEFPDATRLIELRCFWRLSARQPRHSYFTADDARPGKQNKTPKCLFSTTQARGRERGGLKSYHQRQGMSNANARDYSWGICDIRYEIGHPKIFRVCETVSLKFGQVRCWLGLRKTVITTRSTSANPMRR
jgi:hypothetical protein